MITNRPDRAEYERTLTVGAAAFCAAVAVGLAVLATWSTLASSQGSFELLLSNLLVPAALVWHLALTVNLPSRTTADSAVFAFNTLFLCVAPLVQFAVLGFALVNTAQAEIGRVALTQAICAAFIVIYSSAYWALHRRSSGGALADRPAAAWSTGTPLLLATFTLVVLALGVPVYLSAAGEGNAFSPLMQVLRRCVLFLPCAVLLVLLIAYREGERGLWLCLAIAIALFATLLLQNPFTEKRNSLGPVYLAIVFIALRPWLREKWRQLTVISLAIFLLMPVIALFTHSRGAGLSMDAMGWHLLTDHFLETHYDAWANIYSTTELVERRGPYWGRQLLGSLLFFVPSSWWDSKPAATGIEVARYLIDYYAMWFENLSSPLVAEGYIDFGPLGVVGYALLLAIVVRALDLGSEAGRPYALQAACVFFSFFMIFALRGALMVAIAYGAACAVAFAIVGTLIALAGCSGRRFLGPKPLAAVRAECASVR